MGFASSSIFRFWGFLPGCQTINTVLSSAQYSARIKAVFFSTMNVDVSFGVYSGRNSQITECKEELCFKAAVVKAFSFVSSSLPGVEQI